MKPTGVGWVPGSGGLGSVKNRLLRSLLLDTTLCDRSSVNVDLEQGVILKLIIYAAILTPAMSEVIVSRMNLESFPF